jgi:hypothetical protein
LGAGKHDGCNVAGRGATELLLIRPHPAASQQPPVLWLDSGKRVKAVSLETTYIVAAPITAAVKMNAHFHMTSLV